MATLRQFTKLLAKVRLSIAQDSRFAFLYSNGMYICRGVHSGITASILSA